MFPQQTPFLPGQYLFGKHITDDRLTRVKYPPQLDIVHKAFHQAHKQLLSQHLRALGWPLTEAGLSWEALVRYRNEVGILSRSLYSAIISNLSNSLVPFEQSYATLEGCSSGVCDALSTGDAKIGNMIFGEGCISENFVTVQADYLAGIIFEFTRFTLSLCNANCPYAQTAIKKSVVKQLLASYRGSNLLYRHFVARSRLHFTEINREIINLKSTIKKLLTLIESVARECNAGITPDQVARSFSFPDYERLLHHVANNEVGAAQALVRQQLNRFDLRDIERKTKLLLGRILREGAAGMPAVGLPLALEKTFNETRLGDVLMAEFKRLVMEGCEEANLIVWMREFISNNKDGVLRRARLERAGPRAISVVDAEQKERSVLANISRNSYDPSVCASPPRRTRAVSWQNVTPKRMIAAVTLASMFGTPAKSLENEVKAMDTDELLHKPSLGAKVGRVHF